MQIAVTGWGRSLNSDSRILSILLRPEVSMDREVEVCQQDSGLVHKEAPSTPRTIKILVNTPASHQRNQSMAQARIKTEPSVVPPAQPQNISDTVTSDKGSDLTMNTEELKSEIKTLKDAVQPLVLAFLQNNKLAKGINADPSCDLLATDSMCNILHMLTYHIKNYYRIEKTISNLQQKLSEVSKNYAAAFQSREIIKKSLQALSQSRGLSDVLSELRILFKRAGIAPGHLFNENSSSRSGRQSMAVGMEKHQGNEADELPPPEVYTEDIGDIYVLYDVMDTQNNTENITQETVREDGTYDDSDMELVEECDMNITYGSDNDNGVEDLDGDSSSAESCPVGEPESSDYEEEPVRKRKKYKKGRKKVHKCEECGKEFDRTSALKKHVRVHTGEKPYKCSLCDASYRLSYDLKEHERTHTGQRPFTCETCGKSFQKASNFSNHKNTHIKPYKCAVCSKAFPLKKLLNSHVRKHTGERPFTCSNCGVGFIDKRNLTKHIANFHSEPDSRPPKPDKKNVICPICNKQVRQYGLKKHIEVHENIKNFTCDVCDKKFRRKQDMTAHQKLHYSERDHRCHICFKGFTASSRLNAHLKRHEAEINKTFQCQVCEKVLMDKDSLKNHMLIHGAKGFQCGECGKMFSTERNCRDHVKRIHEGQDFICEQCGLVMLSKKGLANHMKIHEGVGPYVCEGCATAFMTEKDLDGHMAPKNRTFRCFQCESEFPGCPELFKHKATCKGSNMSVVQDVISEAIADD